MIIKYSYHLFLCTGDPRDQSLRKVEQNILIPNKVREKSRHHKCKEEMTSE